MILSVKYYQFQPHCTVYKSRFLHLHNTINQRVILSREHYEEHLGWLEFAENLSKQCIHLV